MGNPDIDPNQDFSGALAAAAQRQQGTPPAEDTEGISNGEPSPHPLTEPPDDEIGFGTIPDDYDPLARFASAIDEDPGGEAQPASGQQQQDELDRLLAGKYRTLTDAEAALIHQEQLIGRQGNELGQLRQIVEQLGGRAPAQPVQMPYGEDQIDEIVADPQRAGQFVDQLRQQNHPAFRQAFNRWAEYAPGDAAIYSGAIQARATEERLRAEYAQTLGPIEQQASQQTWLDAWARTEAANPDMRPYAAHMLKDLEQNPFLAAPIQAGHPNAEQAVIENLYLRAKASQQGLIQNAQQQQAQQQAGARQAAHVATAGATPVRPGGGPSDAVASLKATILNVDKGQSVHQAIADGRK